MAPAGRHCTHGAAAAGGRETRRAAPARLDQPELSAKRRTRPAFLVPAHPERAGPQTSAPWTVPAGSRCRPGHAGVDAADPPLLSPRRGPYGLRHAGADRSRRLPGVGPLTRHRQRPAAAAWQRTGLAGRAVQPAAAARGTGLDPGTSGSDAAPPAAGGAGASAGWARFRHRHRAAHPTGDQPRPGLAGCPARSREMDRPRLPVPRSGSARAVCRARAAASLRREHIAERMGKVLASIKGRSRQPH